MRISTNNQNVPLIVRGEVITPSLPVPSNREEGRSHRLRRHNPGGISERLRIDPLVQPNRQILRLVVDRLVGLIDQLQPEDERVLFLKPPDIKDTNVEVLIVIGDSGRRWATPANPSRSAFRSNG